MLHILLFVTDITGQALSDCSVITLTNTELDTRLLRHQDQFIKYIDTTRKKVHASIHRANLTKQTPMSFWYSLLIHLPCSGPLYPYIYHALVLDVPTSTMLWSFMSLHLSCSGPLCPYICHALVLYIPKSSTPWSSIYIPTSTMLWSSIYIPTSTMFWSWMTDDS